MRERLQSIASRCVGISNYDSGFDEGLKAALSDILSGIQGLEAEAGKSNLAEDVLKSIKDFKSAVENDLEELRNFKRLNKQFRDATEELEGIERKFRALESRTSVACSKYFERRQEYAQASQRIKNASQSDIEKLRKKFLDRAASIAEGYELLLSGDSITVEKLFDAILENPASINEAELFTEPRRKGFFEFLIRRKDEEAAREAKVAVLKHVSQELIDKILPVKEAESQELAEREAEFADLRALEAACKEAEAQRAELEERREELRSKLMKIKKEAAFAYSEHEKLLGIKEKYLSIVNELSPKL
ncbi:MAG: hypothetical protein HY930_03500 [Euryarchaeota archaeon]|nr:hypothetical protein [Euryarchaeota archaeon]